MTLRPVFAAALLVLSSLAMAESTPAPAPTPTLGGSPEADLTCAPMPGEAAGHFVCEDPDSFKRCEDIKAAKGKVRVEGETRDTPVLMCMQGG